MELTTIIWGIIGVAMVLIGLKMILKKPAELTPSLETDIHINPDSQQPVIPRHVRDQLQKDARTEPTLDRVEDVDVQDETIAEKTSTTEVTTESVDAQSPKADEPSVVAEPAKEIVENTEKLDKPSTTEAEKPVETLGVLTQVDKAEIDEFNDESSILDAHLHEQQMLDAASVLSTAETFLVLNVYPDQTQRVLSGEKTLKVLLKYGLRFGEMNCFHRYNEDNTQLLFSVLQVTDEGTVGFDLETLSTEEVKGLSFFLALPHHDVQNAFDTMDSISRLIAREIQGTVFDQNNLEFTQQLREYWRHQAIDFRPGHQLGT